MDPHIGLIPKVIPLNLFLDHTQFRKSWNRDLGIANPMRFLFILHETMQARRVYETPPPPPQPQQQPQQQPIFACL